MPRPLALPLIASLALLAGCRTDEVAAPDPRQDATCTVFLPASIEQPGCFVNAGDRVADGNGQILVTLSAVPDGGGGLLRASMPWDVRLAGPLHPGTFTTAALAPATRALLSVTGGGSGDGDYAMSPAYMNKSWGSAEVRLLRVESFPATVGPRALSEVHGGVDLTFANLDDPQRTVVARVSF